MGAGKVMPIESGWKIAIDPENRGKEKMWFSAMPDDVKVAYVPGVIQQSFPEYHGVAWYWNSFVSTVNLGQVEKAYIEFGRVDYFTQAWLNGEFVGEHEGGETAFELDITEALKPYGENLLAVRVINPTHEDIDGFRLKETPHFCKAIPYSMGCMYNYGGIMGPVEISVQPKVRITDVFVRADCKNGRISVRAEIENLTDNTADAVLYAYAGPDKCALAVISCSHVYALTPGVTEIEAGLDISNPVFWSPGNPYLYKVELQLAAKIGNEEVRHQYITRVGFKDFRVREDGFFELNGERLYVKSTHTVNYTPIGICVPHTPEMMTRDLLYAKAMGLNMVRFLGGVAYPSQLDFCDEIGLMVYEESQASWQLEDSPKLAERFSRSLKDMIKRDRNHACVAIWGLLNETFENPTFMQAVNALPLVRELDDTRLVLLSSGRWDCQNVGSVSNPGSLVWQAFWGKEEAGAYTGTLIFDNKKEQLEEWFGSRPGGYFENSGDAHAYPLVPHDVKTISLLRTLGKDTKPVFLSEYGVGSLSNAVRTVGLYEQANASPDLEDFALQRLWVDRLTEDLNKYSMRDVFPRPEDLFLESERMQARQRTIGYNAIRSNPQICGYSLTSLNDVPLGEGLLTSWKELKHGIMDVMRDCLSLLRWCLFVEPTHVYSGRPFKLEAVLVNENILKPGDYPVCVKIWSPAGTVWEDKLTFTIPASENGRDVPLALPVFSKEITLNGPSGTYTFAVILEKGGSPTGGRLDFYISEPLKQYAFEGTVALLGIDERIKTWLGERGFRCAEYTEEPDGNNQVILIGDMRGLFFSQFEWETLFKRISAGCAAVFLDPAVFRKDKNSTYWIPLEHKGKVFKFSNWVYRREDVLKHHKIFNGLKSGGVMDLDYYGQLAPRYLFFGQDVPDETVAMAFAVGYTCDKGYCSGLITGSYKLGAGWFTVNSLRILENVGKNPAADRILINLISYNSEKLEENR